MSTSESDFGRGAGETRVRKRPLIAIAGGASDATSDRAIVLVVDDHEDTRTMYSQFLQAMNFGVVEASTCAEAFETATTKRIDALVLDRRLPDGDGIEVCRAIRSDPRTRAVPIIVLSGRAQGDEPVDADAYLVKPVVPDALVAEIERLLSKRRAT